MKQQLLNRKFCFLGIFLSERLGCVTLYVKADKALFLCLFIRASASQSVDLGFIPLVEPYQKTLKNGIHSFPAWRSAFRRGCGEQAGKFACCVLGQGT